MVSFFSLFEISFLTRECLNMARLVVVSDTRRLFLCSRKNFLLSRLSSYSFKLRKKIQRPMSKSVTWMRVYTTSVYIWRYRQLVSRRQWPRPWTRCLSDSPISPLAQSPAYCSIRTDQNWQDSNLACRILYSTQLHVSLFIHNYL